MQYAHGHAIPCDHVGYHIFSRGLWRIMRVFNHFGNTKAELTDLVNFFVFARLKMTVHNTLLGMPQTVIFCNGNHLMDFIYIEITASAIITF